MLMIREREQRDEGVQRLHVISDMNHHVRNALQVIVYYCSQMEQEPRAETEHAIERIKWSLTAVLPQIQRTEELADDLQPTRRTT
jgi:light-regulated signal transduction histidine kinase (bacteriophytochrome)